MINNERGEELFEKVKNPKPSNREQFWNDFHHKKFRAVAVKYGNFGVANSVKASIKKFLEK